MLSIVSYSCKSFSLTLSDEAKFRVYTNKILGKIYGSMRDENSGKLRHNDELLELCDRPVIGQTLKSVRLRWVGHVVRMGEERTPLRVLMGKYLEDAYR